jgi:hypothetical protein
MESGVFNSNPATRQADKVEVQFFFLLAAKIVGLGSRMGGVQSPYIYLYMTLAHSAAMRDSVFTYHGHGFGRDGGKAKVHGGVGKKLHGHHFQSVLFFV